MSSEDTIAWKDSYIYSSTSNPFEEIYYSITKPSWEIIKLSWLSSNNRKIKLSFSWYHTKKSWIYNIEWKNKNWDLTRSEFNVYPADCSAIQSSITSSQDSLELHSENLEIVVNLKDKYLNPIANQRVKLLSSRFEDEFDDEVVSDSSWKAHFTIKSNKAWISTFTAINLSENKTINQRVKIVFYADNILDPIWWNPYSASLLNSNWWLLEKYSDNFWKVDGFVIETSEEIIIWSDENYMQIEAIDNEWNRVKNYQWTVLIEVPEDPNVILPWEGLYTFTEKDQWIKKYSLSQTFNKEWQLTINVYDYEDWKINELINWNKILNIKTNEDVTTTTTQTSELLKIISPGDWTKLWSNQVNIVWIGLPFTDLKVFVNEEKKWDAETWEDWWFNINIKWLSDWKNIIYVSEKQWERKSSEEVEIYIDTTPPTIDKLEIFPESGITTEDSFNIRIYSEKELSSVKILLNWSIEALSEKKWEPWLYSANIVAPSYSWEYSIDVMLVDSLWNKETYKEESTLTVDDKTPVAPNKMQNINISPGANKVKIKWTKPDSENEIINYKVYLWINSNDLEYFWKTNVNDITIENLIANKKYYFSLSAIDKLWQESEKSDPIEAVPEELSHNSPIWVSSEDKLNIIASDSMVTISWKPLWNQVSNYKIMYWIDQTNLEKIINTNDNSTIRNIEDLINKVPYYFQVVWTDAKWQETTRKSNMVLAVPDWPWILKPWALVDRSKYDNKIIKIIKPKWSAIKTWSELWFTLALCLIITNWLYRYINRIKS